jgi:hypothetical protein
MPIVTTVVNRDKKLVSIWLTNDEKNNASLREDMKPLYAEWKAKKYTVAVFQSGSGDIYDNTLALLSHNRKRSAEVEVLAEKQVSNG